MTIDDAGEHSAVCAIRGTQVIGDLESAFMEFARFPSASTERILRGVLQECIDAVLAVKEPQL